ncbi:MAG TPA: hypothetical protein VG871_09245 [Vicinamibacterales bacterium]|nr:hypothetical protein [Vicinamibacterales bacterium]
MTAFNRVGIAATVLAVSVALARAQTIETPAVAAAKVTIARDIAPSLPRVPLDTWLRDLAGPAAIVTWADSDCGERTGNPALDQGRDVPLCADVRIALASGRTLSLSFLVGTWQHGVGGQPALFTGRFSEPNRPTLPVSGLAVVPSFMSEAARLRQAQRWAAALRPGTTRTEVERQLDHPIEDGGLNRIGHTRYYLGFDVKLNVPFAIAAPLRHAPTDRVSGPAVVSRGGYSMD